MVYISNSGMVTSKKILTTETNDVIENTSNGITTIFYFLKNSFKLSRLDGPAKRSTCGLINEWYINGHYVTYIIHQWAEEMNIDLDNLTDEDKMLIRIYWENYDGK